MNETFIQDESGARTLKSVTHHRPRHDDRIEGGVASAIAHDSAARHVSGRAVYIDDMPELPGTLHLYVAMSARPHARLVSLDVAVVRAAPGVACVLTAADIPGANDASPVMHDDPVFALDKVEYVGQSLFAVAAESIDAARAAAKLARIEYQDLPAMISVDDALAADADLPTAPPHTMRLGDVDAALAAAPHRIKGTMKVGGQDHFYLEGQIAYAIPGEAGDMLVHSSTQHPSEVQHTVAKVLALHDNAVTVEVRRMGGGFGGKESQPSLVAAIAALAAAKTGRPAKLRLDRDDDMELTGKRHDFRIDYEVGFDENGVIKGVRFDQAARCGYSADLSSAIADRAMFHADNAYDLHNAVIHSRRMKTHTVSNTAFRGFGGPQGMVGIERVIDEIAFMLGRDPLDVRRANFYPADGGGITPYHMEVTDCVIAEMVDETEVSSDYRARRAAIRAFNATSPVLKKGIALTPVKFGISFTTTHLNQAGALVHVYKDGSVHLNHGGTEMGQGLFVKVAQVVAEEFQIDLDQVKITATTTAKVPNTSATAASSGSDMNGMAAKAAAETIRKRLVAFAMEKYKVPEEQVVFLPNRVRIGNDEMTFTDLVQEAYLNRISLSSTGFYATPNISYDRETARGKPFFYFAYGAAVSEVAIDTLTGENRLLRVDILHDVGRSLNPAVDLGQIEGGFIQGVGWLTTEELWWNEKGRLMTHAPSTYKIPTANDRPDDMRIQIWEKGVNRSPTIHRSKAVGEPPLMLALSAFSAIVDAVAAAGDYRAFPNLDTPATPERILFAVEDVRALCGGNALMRAWLATLEATLARGEAAVLVHLAELKGSAPREAGAAMLVTDATTFDTIGGGEMERTAILKARELLQSGGAAFLRLSLGPQLNQCCGGSVTLAFEPFAPADLAWLRKLIRAAEEPTPVVRTLTIDQGGNFRRDWSADAVEAGYAAAIEGERLSVRERINPERQALWLFGAGHVGRMVAPALAPLGFAMTWVDGRARQFPEPPLPHVRQLALAMPELAVDEAPPGTVFLVMTHSHPLDEAICEAVLRRGDFAYLGLIGSATKRARFVKRLGEAGIARGELERLVCPIGIPGIESKEPAAIAAAVAADLLIRRERSFADTKGPAVHGE